MMHLEPQLRLAEQEAALGLKGRAVNRLKNIINTYPDEIRVREMLGKLYYEAGFLDLAGLQWLLCESSPEREKCVKVYLKSVKDSPIQVLKDLKYRGEKSRLPLYAQEKLNILQQDFERVNKKSYRKHINTPPKSTPATLSDKLRNTGCGLVLALIVIIFLAGLSALIDFINRIF